MHLSLSLCKTIAGAVVPYMIVLLFFEQQCFYVASTCSDLRCDIFFPVLFESIVRIPLPYFEVRIFLASFAVAPGALRKVAVGRSFSVLCKSALLSSQSLFYFSSEFQCRSLNAFKCSSVLTEIQLLFIELLSGLVRMWQVYVWPGPACGKWTSEILGPYELFFISQKT